MCRRTARLRDGWGELERLPYRNAKVRPKAVPTRQIVVVETMAPGNAVQRILGTHHIDFLVVEQPMLRTQAHREQRRAIVAVLTPTGRSSRRPRTADQSWFRLWYTGTIPACLRHPQARSTGPRP